MKTLLIFLALLVPTWLLAQLPKADSQPKTALPKIGSLILQLDHPSLRKNAVIPLGQSLQLKGNLGLGYMAGKNWQIGGRLRLGWQTNNFGETRNHFPELGLNLYSRHYLDFKRWYAFAELGIGGQQMKNLRQLKEPLVSNLYGEIRYGVGLPIGKRVSLEASNAVQLNHQVSFYQGESASRTALYLLAPKLSLNIRLGK
ncbi:MAG: hypothetical protein AAF399_13695 [Bacteroidota bacterium]